MLINPKISQREAFNALMRTDFNAFVRKVYNAMHPKSDFSPNWHLDLMGEYFTACSRREIKRLIINVPPRSLKSIIGSVAFPAWELGNNPSEKICNLSYNSKLSNTHAVNCRTIMRQPWYHEVFPRTKIAKDNDTKSFIQTTEMGHRIAFSVNGVLTGLGGNYLICDDLLNAKDSMSKIKRDSTIFWLDKALGSRLDDPVNGVIILFEQRLHFEDPTAHLIAKESGWEHVAVPLIAPSPKTFIFPISKKEIKREAGDNLHPSRFPLAVVQNLKTSLGTEAFEAQYQQNPVPDGGHVVKIAWFNRFKAAPVNPGRIVQSWDTAIKANTGSDFSVCLTWYEADNKLYLVDCFRARLEYPDLKRNCKNLYEKHQPHVVLIEDKGSGQQLLQDLRRETIYPIKAILPKNDKITRMSGVSAMIEAGSVYLPEKAAWLPDFEKEIITFPLGSNDDCVDAMSQYLDFARKPTPQPNIRTL